MMLASLEETHKSPQQQMRIQCCLDCHRICLETVAYCLEKGGKYAKISHIQILLDCAELCHAGADFLLRGSEMYGRRICAICGDICIRCAHSLDELGGEGQLRTCIDACQRCVEACR